MAEVFDPYRKWLGIPAAEQPPHHYRLLGVGLFEDDPDVIESAADQRMSHLRSFQTGAHSALSQRLLNEVATAKLCLLDPRKKAVYDAELRLRTQTAPTAAQPIKQTKPLTASPVTVEPVPSIITDSPVKGTSRNTASLRRRKPSLWPAAGLTALLAAIFVGYLVWTKPKPKATAMQPSTPVEQPISTTLGPKSTPLEKPEKNPPAPPQPLEISVTEALPAKEESGSTTPAANTDDQSTDMVAESSPTASDVDSFVPPSATSPNEVATPTKDRPKERRFSDLAEKEKAASASSYDQLSAKESVSLKQHSGAVTRVAFHPTLPLLASSGKDGRVILWNLEKNLAQGEIAKFNEEVWTVKFSPNGDFLAYANRNWWGSVVSFRAIDGGREVKKLKDFKNGGGAVVTVAYSPDGRLFAASQDDGTIRLWETATFQEFPPLSLGTNVFSIAFGPTTFDRKRKPAEYLIAAGCKDGTIQMLRVAVAKEKTGLRRIFETTGVSFRRQQGVICVRFSPDGKRLGAVRFAGLISLYDPETGIAVREMRASNGNADWIAFHPQHPWVATAHWNDKVARVWHRESGAMLCELRGHTAGVMCAEFSRDGQHMATASDDFSIKLWDLAGPDLPETPSAKKGKPPTLLVGE